jgi:DNA-binding PadR family transcriptional regulator
VPDPVTLTPTSYVVLGLVAECEPVTSYEMKQLVAISIGYFWSFPHSQLYAEPARLVDAGLLDEDVEPSGRKRRRYRITASGRAVLTTWLAEPTTEPAELRDLGLLKLFFAAHTSDADRRTLAKSQAAAHDARRAEYERLWAHVSPNCDRWQLATLEMGLRYERAVAAFWHELAE